MQSSDILFNEELINNSAKDIEKTLPLQLVNQVRISVRWKHLGALSEWILKFILKLFLNGYPFTMGEFWESVNFIQRPKHIFEVSPGQMSVKWIDQLFLEF